MAALKNYLVLHTNNSPIYFFLPVFHLVLMFSCKHLYFSFLITEATYSSFSVLFIVLFSLILVPLQWFKKFLMSCNKCTFQMLLSFSWLSVLKSKNTCHRAEQRMWHCTKYILKAKSTFLLDVMFFALRKLLLISVV